MHVIEHTFVPTRLLLVWQAPDGRDRSLLAVGELRDQNGVISFRYLPNTDDFCKAVELGFVCYPAFRKHEGEYTDGVMDSFLRRLPPRSRGDFIKFLEQWCLPATADLSDFALLAYSGAKLPSDGFSLVWPLDEVTAPGEVLLEVAGFRYQGVGLNELTEGMPVKFVCEPDNDKDSKALRIEVGGQANWIREACTARCRGEVVGAIRCRCMLGALQRYFRATGRIRLLSCDPSAVEFLAARNHPVICAGDFRLKN